MCLLYVRSEGADFYAKVKNDTVVSLFAVVCTLNEVTNDCQSRSHGAINIHSKPAKLPDLLH